MRPETYWYILSAMFFAIGIVGVLGEWVFHWWDEPWDWAGPLSLLFGLLTLGWSASARDVGFLRGEVRGLGTAVTSGQNQLLVGQGQLLAGQDRLVTGQDRLVTGQDRLVTGQDHLIATQDRIAASQDRLVEGQERIIATQVRLAEGQERLIAGQAEQTALLREVVTSFRRP